MSEVNNTEMYRECIEMYVSMFVYCVILYIFYLSRGFACLFTYILFHTLYYIRYIGPPVLGRKGPMNSRPCVRPSVRASRKVNGIGSLGFSDFLHEVRGP